ncbi:DNA-binding protein [Dehalobacterium formicoaceticum]|uniref:DNA-binding protein n=1 Tax=Dehalobacterium formicoaceticum TaxID=51515 RepID=A0ABT1Y2S6_9FIRM|nr:DNA-binding protein [Dehalobacterium formicoaceticum]MCR6544786.1 hypothetical protein [Dehalobacterium formicoaceticum]
MADLLPLKFRILHYASKSKSPFSVLNLMKDLKEEYGSDGQFNNKMLSNHLDSLRAVGMIETTKAEFDSAGELVIDYQITDYGKSRLKYLPASWQ